MGDKSGSDLRVFELLMMLILGILVGAMLGIYYILVVVGLVSAGTVWIYYREFIRDNRK